MDGYITGCVGVYLDGWVYIWMGGYITGLGGFVTGWVGV